MRISLLSKFSKPGSRIAKLCPVLILLLRMDSVWQGISRACPIVIGDSPTASKRTPVKLTKRAEAYRYADSWLEQSIQLVTSEGACNIPYTGNVNYIIHSLVPRLISQALWLGLSFILQAIKALKISLGTRLYNSNMADFLLCLVSTVTIFSSTILLWLKKPAMIEFRHLRSYVLPRRLCWLDELLMIIISQNNY